MGCGDGRAGARNGAGLESGSIRVPAIVDDDGCSGAGMPCPNPMCPWWQGHIRALCGLSRSTDVEESAHRRQARGETRDDRGMSEDTRDMCWVGRCPYPRLPRTAVVDVA